MKIGVVQFPGSNCERETKIALLRNGFTPVDCFWNSPYALVASLDGFVIVGGFSYEDRVRSGLIAAKDPFMQLLANEAMEGKPILGICNGAQILVESGLVPGFKDRCVAMALAHNHRVQQGCLVGTGFYNDWVYIKTLTGKPIYLPIAHAEGRFLMDHAVYQALQSAGARCYYYCNQQGNIVSEFPINPNGSYANLAAISNFAGNVLAMMPHPERTPAGDIIFEHFNNTKISKPDIKTYAYSEKSLSKPFFEPYVFNEKTLHYWVRLLIHDNEAISLETTLQNMGFTVTLKKRIHWEVFLPSNVDQIGLNDRIKDMHELFNEQKEGLVKRPKAKLVYFVREREDDLALKKQTILRQRLNLFDLTLIREVVWLMDCPANAVQNIKEVLEKQTILANPLAHTGWLDEA